MTASSTSEVPDGYEPHVGETRQYWRDIILGVNDGLVSVYLLVAGVVGGNLGVDGVLLSAVAAALAGAISMGAGEYLATKSQDEVLAAEIQLEKTHIRDFPQMELDQLRGFFGDMGLEGDDLDTVVGVFARSDSAMLEAMAALEFGAVESERRSPFKAMATSAGFFLAGSMTSLLPLIVVDSVTSGFVWASILTAIALFGVGVIKSRVTKTSSVVSGLENLAITAVGAGIAYLIGGLISGSLA